MATAPRKASAKKAPAKIPPTTGPVAVPDDPRLNLEYCREHRDFFRLSEREFGCRACGHGPHAKHLDELRLAQVKLLDQILQQAVRRKAIRPIRTEAAASAIFDLTRSIVMQRLRGASKATLDEDIGFAFDLTWKGIGCR